MVLSRSIGGFGTGVGLTSVGFTGSPALPMAIRVLALAQLYLVGAPFALSLPSRRLFRFDGGTRRCDVHLTTRGTHDERLDFSGYEAEHARDETS